MLIYLGLLVVAFVAGVVLKNLIVEKLNGVKDSVKAKLGL